MRQPDSATRSSPTYSRYFLAQTIARLSGFDAGRLLQRILLCLIHGFSFAILASAARINGVKPYLLS